MSINTRNKSVETLAKDKLRSKTHYQLHPEYYKKWQTENVASRLCSIAKQRAKQRGIPFSITKEDLVVPTHCPILGIELHMNQDRGAGGKYDSFSLDKIDPEKGYIPGNVQVISHKANSMKYTANKEELLLFAKWIMETYND